MTFLGESDITTVNGVDISDAVFDTGIQHIASKKGFTSSVYIEGDVTTDMFNGIDISEAYNQAIIDTEDQTIYGNIVGLI